MYDAIDWAAIPPDAPAVAGYVDGYLSKWPPEAWLRFSTSRVLHICTWGPRNLGDTLDIERGDSVPADARPYALNARSRGVAHPKLYMSVTDFPIVYRDTSDLDCRYWTAHYTGFPHLCNSHCNNRIPNGVQADGTQWQDQPALTGGDFDLSICKARLFD